MYSGEKLGQALAEAIQKKGVKKADVARAFGIKQPSISDWIKSGRIGKQHIDKLVEYFSDVVPPSHFGIHNLSLVENQSIYQMEKDKVYVLTISDEKIRQQAFEVIEQYGMTPEQVFNLFLREIATTQSIPLRFDYLRKQDE